MNTYIKGGIVTAIIGFVLIWLYSIAAWGLLFGLLFGWLPAVIGAVVLGVLWPLVALAAFIVYLKVAGAF